MTAVAYIGQTDFLRRTVNVYIGEELPDGRLRARQHDGTIVLVEDGSPSPERPTLTLRNEEATALLQALVRHFDGGEDTRRLRKDYDAERARVDKLTDALSGIAARSPVVIHP